MVAVFMVDSQNSKGYCSIIDCPTCEKLPSKMYYDLDRVGRDKIPAELNQLSTVISLDLETEHAYSSNTVKLLKCPRCGTYYYFSHYVDEGEHFMDPTSNDLAVRRYPPLTVIVFLEGIINKTPGTVPQPPGKLRKAFLEGTYPQPNEPIEEGRETIVELAGLELNELKTRYETIIGDFIEIVESRSPEWQIKKYIVDSLVLHFINNGDWNGISKLLKHGDPVIRLETLKNIVRYSTEDAAVIDIIHVPYDIRKKYAKILKKKGQMDEIVQVTVELALSDHGYTQEYDDLCGYPEYYRKPVQDVALYCIVVLAKFADLSKYIPQLVDLLSENKHLNYMVSWALGSIAEQNKENAKLILKLIKNKKSQIGDIISQDEEIQRLLKLCRKELRKTKKRTEKKATNNKGRKKDG
jgi:hypothetical protein